MGLSGKAINQGVMNESHTLDGRGAGPGPGPRIEREQVRVPDHTVSRKARLMTDHLNLHL